MVVKLFQWIYNVYIIGQMWRTVQFLQMILSVFVLCLCASSIVSNPRQERQASGNEVDLDDEGMYTDITYVH